jgi:hypothetical protein
LLVGGRYPSLTSEIKPAISTRDLFLLYLFSSHLKFLMYSMTSTRSQMEVSDLEDRIAWTGRKKIYFFAEG